MTDLIDDFKGWLDQNGNEVLSSTCGNSKLLGGYGLTAADTVTKKYNLGGSYSSIKIKFDLWAIDSWNGEYFIVNMNNRPVLTKYHISSERTQSLCGDSLFGDTVYEDLEASLELPCAEDTIVITFTSNLDQASTNEAYGVRNLRIFGYNRCSSGCECCPNPPYQNYCTKCFEPVTEICEKSVLSSIVRDLDENFDGWTDLSGTPVTTSYCGGELLLGGVDYPSNKVIQKTFALPGNYTNMKLTIELWTIDTWRDEYFYISVNDRIIFGEVVAKNRTNNLCGNEAIPDEYHLIEARVELPCVTDTLSIQFFTNLQTNSANQAWGLRKLTVFGWNRCKEDCQCCLGHPYSGFCKTCFQGASSCIEDTPAPIVQDLNRTFLGWKDENGNGVPLIGCKDPFFLGGFGYLGNKTMTKTFNLGGYYSDFIIELDWIAIDYWQSEVFVVTVNGVISYFQYHYTGAVVGENQCGNRSYPEKQYHAYFTVQLPCATDEVTLLILGTRSGKATYENFYGVKNLEIYGWNRCPRGCKCCESSTLSDVCTECFFKTNRTCLNTNNFPLFLKEELNPGGWHDQYGYPIETTLCGINELLGGFQVTSDRNIIKTFTLEEEYTDIGISAEIWALDNWNGEFIEIYVNDIIAYSKKRYGNSGANFCGLSGPNANEEIFRASGVVELTCKTRQVTVKFVANLSPNSTHHSYGIRNFKIYGRNRCGNGCDCCLTSSASDICISDKVSIIEEESPSTKGWINQNGLPATVSYCGTELLLGGPDSSASDTFSKVYTFPTTYTDIAVTFDWYALDNWGDDHLLLYINDNLVFSGGLLEKIPSLSQNLCGSPDYPDSIFRSEDGYIQLLCATNFIKIEFKASLSSSKTSKTFGIKNLKIYGWNRCSENCECCMTTPNQNQCTKCLNQKDLACRNQTFKPLATDLITSFEGWAFQSGEAIKTTKCGPMILLGGYGVTSQNFIYKRFSLNGDYNQIAISFEWVAIDSWNQESLYAMIEDQVVYLQTRSGYAGTNMCGSDLNNAKENIFLATGIVTLPCTTRIVDVKIGTTLDQGPLNEAFGIRNLRIYGRYTFPNGCKCVVSLSEPTTCSSCLNGYFFEDGKCSQCDESCLTCISGTEYGCLSCSENRYITPENTCISGPCPDKWHQDDDSMTCFTCTDPFCSKCPASKDLCIECKSQTYLLEDTGSCYSYCPEQYRESDLNYTCERCLIPNCKNCDTSVYICDVCVDSHYLTEEKECLPCKDPGCKTCNETFCFVWADGHVTGKEDKKNQPRMYILAITFGIGIITVGLNCWIRLRRRGLEDQSASQQDNDQALLEELERIVNLIENEPEDLCDPNKRGLCYVDGRNKSNIIFEDCMHICACESCANRIMAGSKKCPICRTKIKSIKKVFVT